MKKNMKNNNNIIVSVCMITYNHEDFIAKAIEGVLNQKTEFDYNIIIGVDCSTDRTREILIQYQKKYPEKIHLILHKHNIGSINNFVETLQSGNSKYIAFCEGDDYWTDPLKLQKQVDFLEANPDFSLCFHNALILWDDKSKPPKYFCSKDQKEVSTVEDVIEKWFIPSASMVLRKEHIMPLPGWFKDIYNGDYAMHLLLANKGKIGYIDEVMSVYRKAPGSFSFNPKITTEYVNNKKIKLFHFFNKETGFNYDKQVQRKIAQLEKQIKLYKLNQKSKFLYYLRNPINSFGKILLNLGNKILNEE
jgi:glycosyltransferase involved in cell wall biosynthesis